MNISGTEEQSFTVNGEYTNLLTGEKVTGTGTLKAKGFMILSK